MTSVIAPFQNNLCTKLGTLVYCDDPPLPQVLQRYGTIAVWWWWMSNSESTAYTAMMLFNNLHVVSCCYRLHCTYTCKLHFSSSTLWSPQATTDNLRILWHIHYSEQGISCLNICCHAKSELTAPSCAASCTDQPTIHRCQVPVVTRHLLSPHHP